MLILKKIFFKIKPKNVIVIQIDSIIFKYIFIVFFIINVVF